MKQFSEQLRQLIDDRNIAIYTLAAESGVDRTLIHKTLKGERVSTNQSVVRALSSALLLTPEENSALFESYLAAKMGEQVYARRKFVLDFYNRFDPAPVKDSVLADSRRPAHALTDNEVVYGKLEVSNLVQAVLETEAAKEEGHIRILAQPECSFLFDFLPVIGVRHKALSIDHIVCLENSLKERNSLYNLNCLRAMMPILASGCRYQPRCYYDSIAGHFGSTSVMPYLILTEDYVVQISYDASCAAISSFSQNRALYGRIFQSFMEKSAPLATVFHSPFEEIDYMNRLYSDFYHLDYDFTSDPCLLPFAGEEMVRRYLNPALLKDEGSTRSILEYLGCSNLDHWLKQLGKVYFSEEGIERFLATGRLTEVPVEYYSPLEAPERYRLLRSMYEAALAGEYHPVLANAKRMNIPANLSTYSFQDGAVCFVYTVPNREYTTFFVTEKSIVTALQDFFNYLPESNLVLSPEETLRYLKEKLDGAPC